MSEKDLEQLKREAAEKAKAAAKRKLDEKQGAAAQTEDPEQTKKKAAEEAKKRAAELAKAKSAEGVAESETTGAAEKAKAAAAAKAKAAAAAKAKAAALAKQQAADGAAESEATGADEKAKAAAAAKAKAAAAAKAKAAAAAKAKAKAKGTDGGGDDEKAKAIAAAKAKAAALAKAKSVGTAGTAEAKTVQEEPSPNQPYLDKYIKVIEDHLGNNVLEDAYINKLSKDVPTLVAKPETYLKIAEFLKYNEQLGFDYLSEHHGTDFQSHMEVYNHLYSYKNRQSVALKVKIDRDNSEIDSLTPLWAGANWPERESYDLLGIKYLNHPNLTRIMLADDWVGYPLRKDYEQYDVEV